MKIEFLGNNHTNLLGQNQLLELLENKYKDYDLWLEFLYPTDIKLIKSINKFNEDEILEKILDNLTKNNKWSIEYNQNLINIIKKALKFNINIFALEKKKYSLHNFVKTYGVNGMFYYINDRISDQTNGCNDRWIKMVKNNQKITKKNQIIFAGNLHKDPLERLLDHS